MDKTNRNGTILIFHADFVDLGSTSRMRKTWPVIAKITTKKPLKTTARGVPQDHAHGQFRDRLQDRPFTTIAIIGNPGQGLRFTIIAVQHRQHAALETAVSVTVEAAVASMPNITVVQIGPITVLVRLEA